MLNKFIGMGRLVKDPELRTTPSGTNVCSFTIAVDRNYTDGSGKRPTDFFNCFAFGTRGDHIAKYYAKGSPIIVVGSVETRSWEDKGVKRYATEIKVDESYFAGKKENSTSSVTNVTASPQGEAFEGFMPEDSDDLPF